MAKLRLNKHLEAFYKVPYSWFKHFSGQLVSEKGYIIIGSIIGVYFTIFTIAASRHDRSTTRASNELNVFLSMVSSGNQQSFVPAIKNFKRVQGVKVVSEPSLYRPFEWWNVEYPNKETLYQWAKDAFPLCKVELCGHMDGYDYGPDEDKYSYRIDLRQADLNGVYLEGVKLVELDISKGSLSNAQLSEADFSGANLSFSRNKYADMRACNFSEADLRGANMSWVNFSPIKYNNNYEKTTNFFQADLRGVNFHEANLEGANLTKADIRGASFLTAKLKNIIMREAKYDSSTVFPKGFKPSNSGLIFVNSTLPKTSRATLNPQSSP